jgi:large subunit ribosomal protein L4
VIEVGELNAYDVLCSDVVVFTTAPSRGRALGKTARRASALEGDAPRGPRRRRCGRDAGRGGRHRRCALRPGSHAPLEDDEQPEGFPIKGNADSMLYHVPDSRFYNQTKAEVWFATEAEPRPPASPCRLAAGRARRGRAGRDGRA